MILVDTELRRREDDRNPIRVGLVGAGAMGKALAFQVTNAVPGMEVVAIANRTLDRAEHAYRHAGAEDVAVVSDLDGLHEAMARGTPAVTDDAFLLCAAEGLDAI